SANRDAQAGACLHSYHGWHGSEQPARRSSKEMMATTGSAFRQRPGQAEMPAVESRRATRSRNRGHANPKRGNLKSTFSVSVATRSFILLRPEGIAHSSDLSRRPRTSRDPMSVSESPIGDRFHVHLRLNHI